MNILWVLRFLEGPLRSAVQVLRNKDANTSGWDDLLANAFDFALDILAAYKKDPTGGPSSPVDFTVIKRQLNIK